jgi:hypothetical protein
MSPSHLRPDPLTNCERRRPLRRLVTNTVLGVQIAAFALVCVMASPMILFKFGVDWVRDRIEARWPDSERARAVSFWIGLLAPLVFCVVMLVVLIVLASRVRNLRQQEVVRG